MRIWKFSIYVQDGPQRIFVPGADESKVVAMRMDLTSINIWIEVHPDSPLGPLEFLTVGTGHEIPLSLDRQMVHSTTVFDDQMGLVWHVYQLHPIPVAAAGRAEQ